MLRSVGAELGPPWHRPLRGSLDIFTVESEILALNPLGDPWRRPLYVYRAPGIRLGGDGAVCASIFMLQGYSGLLDMLLRRPPFEPSVIERIDALFATPGVPPAVIAFVDAWTSYGGSQFLNSSGTGRYLDYLCDEVVPFINSMYPVVDAAAHRGITGKSSGGYGAMVVPMLRPGVFGGLASHAGDALFECCCLPKFPRIARTLREHFDGSWETFLASFYAAATFDSTKFALPLEFFAYGLCYSPDSTARRPRMPFAVDTGRLVDDVWEQWLAWDPVRMAPRHLETLAGMRCIYLDAGDGDEHFLDLGARAFGADLDRGGVEHTVELFEGRHGGLEYR